MKQKRALGILSFIFLVLVSCKVEEESPIFQRLDSEETGIDFINEIKATDSLNVYDYVYFYNGGGVAVGDVNGDNLKDIFFTGNMVTSRLYLNKGDWVFEDVTHKAGVDTKQWTTGATMTDINGDGHIDIYVSVAGSPDPENRENLLFINNGDGTFQEQAELYGIADKAYTTQSAFFDFDRDGDLDLYLLNHTHEISNLNVPKPISTDGSHPSTDKLYRNNGDGTFTDISIQAGISIEGYGLGIAVSDINRDGWPDIYVANDFISNDLMYINNKNGTFSNKIDQYLAHQSWSGMGNEVADYNNDGYVDIFVLDMLPESRPRQMMMAGNLDVQEYEAATTRGYEIQYVRNTLQLNNGNGSFSEIGQLAGVDKTDWSWSSLFADFDNDGFKDLFVSNGYLKKMTFLDFITRRRRLMMFQNENQAEKTLLKELERLDGIKEINKIFKNNGDLTFDDYTKQWGFSETTFSNGAAYGDLDNDGDLDLVINNINDEAFLYKNTISDEKEDVNYLNVQLRGSKNNREGLGSKVWIYTDGELQFAEKYNSRGYQSSVSNILHFGLGNKSVIDSVKIVWPDGKHQKLKNASVNETLILDYSEAIQEDIHPLSLNREKPVFKKNETSETPQFLHKENPFNDFNENPLLRKMYSRGGPGIAIGDINGNGLDDLFIGGAAGQAGTMFFQQNDGKFTEKKFVQDSTYEDMGALLFDADQDNDLDLYVVSGGSEFKRQEFYQDRLYINDGKGNFSRESEALPEIYSSGSCVVGSDYDKDGDIDLFICGRVQPESYPFPSRSYLLENESGQFKDATAEKALSLTNPGLVASALWTDYNNDSWMDLILVGEWMPISVFQNEEGVFTEKTHSLGLAESHGWWNSIISGDFDRDGDMDYVAGNNGLNSSYEASIEEPVEGFAYDFNNDRETEFVLSRYLQNERYPVFPRDMMMQSLPYIKYRFTNYSDYAVATTSKLFAEGHLDEAHRVYSNHMETSFIENRGEDGFEIKPLPIQAQISPVLGSISHDFDLDGYLDLLLIGNDYSVNTITGRQDASIGNFLKGKENGEFESISVNKSGFVTDGDTRSIALAVHKDRPLIFVSTNNGSLQKFTIEPDDEENVREGSRVELQHDDSYAIIHFPNGKKQKVEFTYGNGYLSQSSRTFFVPDSTESTDIFKYNGSKRTIE